MNPALRIDSQLTLTNIPEEFKQWFMEQLTFDNPVYLEAIKQGRSTYRVPPVLKMYRALPNGIVIPRGYLQIVEDAMIGQGYGLQIKDNRVLLPPIFTKPSIKLYSYQEEAKYLLLSHSNGMMVAPAASGKTIMGLDVFASLHQKALWLTHTNRLSKQVVERILDVFEDIEESEIGVIGGGKFKIGERITIGMIPTLVRKIGELPALGRSFGLVILDEAHHAPASTFLEVLSYFASFYMYGLTATPYRRDSLEDMMFASIGLNNSTIERKTVREKGKIITPTVIVRHVPSKVIDTNDYAYLLREELPSNLIRTKMIVDDVLSEARAGNFCIVICLRKAYAQTLFELIFREWPKTGIATGDSTRKQNDEQVYKLNNDDITVLITTFELLGEGFDVPKLNRGFIALPFRERARIEQAVGRIQRTAPNKKDAILYDYMDYNIGILKNQFIHRALAYRKLGMQIINN